MAICKKEICTYKLHTLIEGLMISVKEQHTKFNKHYYSTDNLQCIPFSQYNIKSKKEN